MSIESPGAWTVYSPAEIRKALESKGARFIVEKAPEPKAATPPPVEVREDIARCVERMVRVSEKTCDVAVEDITEDFTEAAAVASIGVNTGVLKAVRRDTSGPKKRFVRFKVDRARVLLAQLGPSGDAAIDKFWAELKRKFPS